MLKCIKYMSLRNHHVAAYLCGVCVCTWIYACQNLYVNVCEFLLDCKCVCVNLCVCYVTTYCNLCNDFLRNCILIVFVCLCFLFMFACVCVYGCVYV